MIFFLASMRHRYVQNGSKMSKRWKINFEKIAGVQKIPLSTEKSNQFH
jgi:hypothetical protein